jgi:hypothetical protein
MYNLLYVPVEWHVFVKRIYFTTETKKSFYINDIVMSILDLKETLDAAYETWRLSS